MDAKITRNANKWMKKSENAAKMYRISQKNGSKLVQKSTKNKIKWLFFNSRCFSTKIYQQLEHSLKR